MDALLKRRMLLLDLAVNILLPWWIYRHWSPSVGDTRALIFAALPSLLWSGVEWLWHRRLDALSLVSLLGIALSLLALLLGGSPRLLLVRESLITGVLGLLALTSLLARRPVLYHLAEATLRREGGDALARFQQRQAHPAVQQALRTMTLVWGGGMLLEAVLRSSLAWTLPIAHYLAVSPFILYGSFALLGVWTARFRRQLKQRLEQQAAQEVAA